MTHKLPIYFDYAATTPVDERVIAKMIPCLSYEGGTYANPGSYHALGGAASTVIETAREVTARLINATARNIIFTSGATESNNLAIKGIAEQYQKKGKHIITCATEHKSVLEPCAYLAEQGFEITYLKSQSDGLLNLADLRAALREDTILVSIMQVNNETGVVQDIKSIGEITKQAQVLLHVDAVQGVGKMPINVQTLNVNLMSFSAHKLYGPKGIGALYVGDLPKVKIKPQLQGGGQERKMRSGTLATHQICGMGEAFRLATLEMDKEIANLKKMRESLWEGICHLPGVFLNGHPEKRAPHILNVRFEGMPKEALLAAFKDLAMSSASTCNSITLEPSHILRAMGLSNEAADRSLRFSVGRFTTPAEIEFAIRLINQRYQPV